jgi:hypothetical protein
VINRPFKIQPVSPAALTPILPATPAVDLKAANSRLDDSASVRQESSYIVIELARHSEYELAKSCYSFSGYSFHLAGSFHA